VKYLIYFDVEVHDHEVAGKLQVATVRNIYSLQIEIESKAADWVGGGRGGTTIGAGGMYPHLFSNRSVFTVLTSPPTFQCIDPPPSNSWRRPWVEIRSFFSIWSIINAINCRPKQYGHKYQKQNIMRGVGRGGGDIKINEERMMEL